MSTHAPYSRNVPMWKPPGTARRVPVPSAAAVAAAPALAALFTVLDGQPPPCAAAPDVWTSDHADDLLVAAESCAGCPARVPCLAYGRAVGATAGVFGGVDLTARDGRRRPTDDTIERASA